MIQDRIALATCRTWPELSVSDRCLADALERRGFGVEAAPWNGPFEPFARAAAVVIRATWDYHQALDEYRAWLDRLTATRTFNAPDLIRWNLEKTYLNELATRGVRVPASMVLEADAAAIAEGLDRLALADAVIKPIVGASGFGVERVSRGREAEAVARLRAVTRSPRLFLQEFLSEVVGGEVAGVFLGGSFSHGLRRVPAAGEFRVNSQYGGRMEAAALDAETVETMTRIVSQLPHEPLFARIDGVSRDGRFLLMEVEVNEPDLGLHLAPDTGERFAAALLGELDSRRRQNDDPFTSRFRGGIPLR
jgi:glutathione synthase/RimK-type ligase-like ATP-grasp enzyme